MKNIASLALAAAASIAVSAQNTAPDALGQWDLGKCIEYGLEHNISVKQQEINVENQEISLQTTRASRLPSLSANIGENYNIGRSQNREGVYEDHGAFTTSLGANAQVAVFQGFRINNQIKADKLSLEAATQDLEQARQDISLQIVSAYLQVLYAKENEKTAQRQLEINKDLCERTRKMVDGGRSSVSELYDAESALASAESNLVTAVGNTRTALLDLAQSINFSDYASFDISVPDTETMMTREALTMTPPDTIYTDYIERRPSVIAARKRSEQAERAVKVAQGAYWPTINFGASYGTGYYSTQKVASGGGTFWDQLGHNGSTTLGASLNIPIFMRLSTRNSVRQARNQARYQELALQQIKLNVFKEVQQAYVNAVAAYGEYQANLKSVEAASKAFEFEQKRYESGRSTAYQFNEVRQKLANAEAQLNSAKYSFLLRAKILNFYKGEPLY